jgi:hypothetical protein
MNIQTLSLAVTLTALSAIAGADDTVEEKAGRGQPLLWQDPGNIGARDLFYGSGGKAGQPGKKFTFLKEDRGGSAPKFNVRDENGTEWAVKFGDEARPEVAATRLVWAVGYFTDDDYLVPSLYVDRLPRLSRGQSELGPDGSVPNARLERRSPNLKWKGSWKWRKDELTGTRELNGLRVLMALLNNWDAKDSNNSVLVASDGSRPIYAVGDLGSTLGPAGFALPLHRSDVNGFTRSKFIVKATPEYVNFASPGYPGFMRIFAFPRFVKRLQMRSVGQHVPRWDAKWIGRLLAQLSPEQIRSAFRAAGYSPAEVEALADTIERRIALLTDL